MEIARRSFGPVAPIITATDEKQALEIANDSKFGLGASIWSQDLEKAERAVINGRIWDSNCQ